MHGTTSLIRVSVHFFPSALASITKQFWTLNKPTAKSLNKVPYTILAF